MDLRIRTEQRLLVPAFMVVSWIVSTGLLLAWHGELFGTSSVGRGQAGGFVGGSPVVWAEHVSLLALALFAASRGRSDVMGLLLLGPAIAFGLVIVGDRWIDPTWSEEIVRYYTLGWLISLISAIEYYVLFPESVTAS